ncbi:hypothetical protein RIR_jg4166.t1 [Rhizophagus irregularis DAOM 181602=DAOM 197198]|nr:hypothetical protein RIR_jg4166.t1 [Rhizophagus irregularis DAOM 181602=DAOM 197198]
MHISDHITYFNASLLSDAIKSARARQLGLDPHGFDAWPLNQKCEYLHSKIIKAANSTLPSVTVGNTYTPKKPEDLESLCQSYRFLSKVAKTIRSLYKTPTLYSIHHETKWSSYYIRLNNLLSLYKQTFVTPIILPPFLRDERIDDFANLLQMLENDNFTHDISTFIESALSRTRRRIILNRVFVDHPLHPILLTSPDAIDQEVIEHFQNFVPITSTPPSSIQDCLNDGSMLMRHLPMSLQLFSIHLWNFLPLTNGLKRFPP